MAKINPIMTRATGRQADGQNKSTMNNKIFPAILTAALILMSSSTQCHAQTVYVKDTVMVTYPFSEPDPIPNPGTIYPYWKFRQFSITPVQQTWKMVVLENEWLRVKIFPEIGGKVWSVFDKTAGQEMFYDNDAVKFREIAMRGPWTSGGIEFNYGVIGHAPTTSAPVDWSTEVKADGSVSCYIGASELLSHSRWTIEINLPKDAVWLRTSSFWHNGSSEYQPYYNWANSGVRTSDDMMLIYPAENAIGHSGEPLTYPLNEKGTDIRYYPNQAYGADKSYHMVGSHKPFFGAYYSNDDWGVLHYALRDEKLGRKYFCWAQSEQGSIWVDLLTDGRPQYIEMQSGRLFNQNTVDCSQNSAYRQILFTPYGTDTWSEYWLPFKGIGPADDVNLYAVTSITRDGGRTTAGIYPLRHIEGELKVTDASGNTLFCQEKTLTPAQPVSVRFKGEPAIIAAGGHVIWRAENGRTDRPQQSNTEFDRTSPRAKVMMARDLIGMKHHGEAEKLIDEVLAAEPGNIDALNLKAHLLFHRMRYQEARTCSDKALAIDQYDPEAGYVGGLAAAALGRIPEAMDRFEVAAIANSPIRYAAYTELARQRFIWGDLDIAADYARKALTGNAVNLTALFILHRAAGTGTDAVTAADPLCHLPAAEKLITGATDAAEFASGFKSEIIREDFLELAVFYNSLGLKKEASIILEALPQRDILTSLWNAYLKNDIKLITDAERQTLDFVFPYRRETAPVLAWALRNGGGWKTEYLMAMLQDSFGYGDIAEALLKCEETEYAPYYAYRYKFTQDIRDLQKAHSLEPDRWLYLWRLCTALNAEGRSSEAVGLMEPYYAGHPEVMQIGDALIDAYIAEGRYEEAEVIVDRIVYLPFEGQRGSHDKFSHIKQYLAAKAIDSGDLDQAEKLVNESLEWPTRLGAGKPYDDLIDTSKAEWLKKEIEARRSGSGPFEPVTPRLENFSDRDQRLFN